MTSWWPTTAESQASAGILSKGLVGKRGGLRVGDVDLFSFRFFSLIICFGEMLDE